VTISVSSPAEAEFASLDRATRRRLLVGVLGRTLGSLTVLVLAYFLLPYDRVDGGGAVLVLGLGLLAVVALLVWQVRQIVGSAYPVVRAVEAVATSVPVYLLLFSIVYYFMSRSSPDSFNETLSRMDALYFGVTVFSTVGFGDIAARNDVTRAVVTVQMVLNLLLIAGGLRFVLAAVKRGQERRATPTPPA